MCSDLDQEMRQTGSKNVYPEQDLHSAFMSKARFPYGALSESLAQVEGVQKERMVVEEFTPLAAIGHVFVPSRTGSAAATLRL